MPTANRRTRIPAHERPWRAPLRHGWTPAEPLRRPVLFVNPNSGGGKAVRSALAERAQERGIEAVTLGPGADLGAMAAEQVELGADALGVAGGDGSLGVVAAVALEAGLPFVCVPAGTRNHFALDLGVDRRDLVGALDAFTDAVERHIDVAEVNGRLFLNNLSLGIYGDAVQRPGYRDAKLRTILDTVREVRSPSGGAPGLRVVDDLGREHRHPAVVLVSNNPYALERPVVTGTRPTLASGRLGVLLLDPPSDARDAPRRTWAATAVSIDAADSVGAGIDGEAVELRPPLLVAIRPAALRVRISSHHPGVSPSGMVPPSAL